MAYNYTLIVEENKPLEIAPGLFWLKASQGLLMIYFQNGNFHHIAAGKGNLAIADGSYFKAVIESDTTPVSPAIGDLWLQPSQNAYWAYLGAWVPFGGA